MNLTESSDIDNGMKGVMKEGDTVIAYERADSLDYFVLKKDAIYNNKHGAFRHNDFLGQKFGMLVANNLGDGFLYALRPTPELWSIATTTRTQIVDEFDQSFVAFHLDIYPGCRVVDTGTGSGCNTISFARAVAPNGRVHSFEYNEVRSTKAEAEFKQLGVSHLIDQTWRDVCNDGFDGLEDGCIDAVFLDLPEPWRAIRESARVLKPGRSICSYSPCIEQVTRTCDALRANGFHSIHMVEQRFRPHQARTVPLETPDMGSSSSDTCDTYFADVPHAAADRRAKIEAANASAALRAQVKAGRKAARDEKKEAMAGDSSQGGTEINGSKKRQRTDRVGQGEEGGADKKDEDDDGDQDEEDDEDEEDENRYGILSDKPSVGGTRDMLVHIPSFLMKGHTAFLTFATK